MGGMKKCQTADCEQDAAWIIPDYFTKGSVAHKRLGIRAALACEEHGKERVAINPFIGWRRLADSEKIR